MDHAATVSTAATDRAAPARPGAARAWAALAVLVLITIVVSVDRAALPLQAERIRRSLQLSDVQLGLLQDTGGAIFAALAAVPIAWAADRFQRRLVLLLCMVLWTLAVIGCGLAGGFGALFAATSLLAAGTASVQPLSMAYIGELFDAARRQLANSLFYFAIAGGGAVGMIAMGQLIGIIDQVRGGLASLAALAPWRVVFFAVAAPAAVALPLTFVLPRNATRTGPSRRADAEGPAGRPSMIGFLLANRRMMLAAYGAILFFAFGQAAVGTWINIIALRSFGQSPAQVGAALGATGLMSLPAGLGLNLVLTPFLTRRLGPAASVRLLTWAFAVVAALYVGMAFARSASVVYALFLAINVAIVTAGMNYPTIFQALGPPALLSRIFAGLQIVVTAGAATAGPLVGLLSDHAGKAPFALLTCATLTGAAGLALGAVAFAWLEAPFKTLTRSMRSEPA